jgi:hypothetical protein
VDSPHHADRTSQDAYPTLKADIRSADSLDKM